MTIYCPLSEALGLPQPEKPINYSIDIPHEYDPEIASFEAKKRNSEIVICDKCGISGNRPNMMRWHFENCKTVLKNCLYCDKIIPRQNVKNSIYRKKFYCDQVCYNESKKGKSPIEMTPEIREKLSKSAKKTSQERSDRMKKNQVWKNSGRWNTL